MREHFKLSKETAVSIPTGVQAPSDLISKEDARIALCKKLKLPEETRFIGQVSVLRRWKGHHDVMAAFEKIHQNAPQYHLVFAGVGGDRLHRQAVTGADGHQVGAGPAVGESGGRGGCTVGGPSIARHPRAWVRG